MPETGADGGRVLFFGCKNETHTSKQGFKQLFRRLRTMYRPERLDSLEDFRLDTVRGASILVFGCPRERYTVPEFEILKRYVRAGGSVLVLLAEGGEAKAGTNINYWLEEYGISVNADAVVRTTHYKYLHPKEVLISDGVLNRGVLEAVGKGPGSEADGEADFRATKSKGGPAFDGTGLEFVYPYGATLSVQAPAVPILSSGKIAYPMNRPLGACVCVRAAASATAARASVRLCASALCSGPCVRARQARCGTWRARGASRCWAPCSCLTTSTSTRRRTPSSWTSSSSG